MKILKSILLVLILFFINSCYKDFRYNINNTKKINVICFLKANDTVRVNVSFTFSSDQWNELDSQYIENADVFIYEENELKEKLIYKEYSSDNKWYISQNFFPKEGKNYELKVIVPGYDTIFAQTYIPISVKIDTVRSILTTDYIYGDKTYILNHSIEFTDIDSQKNYYSFNIYNYDIVHYNYDIVNYESYDPVIENKNSGNYYSYISGRVDNIPYFSDTLFSNSSYSLSVSNYFHDFYPDTMIFYDELYSLSKDAYLFYKTAFLYSKIHDNPLSEPVVMYSNIKNGTGIFAGMSSDVDSIILIKNQIK